MSAFTLNARSGLNDPPALSLTRSIAPRTLGAGCLYDDGRLSRLPMDCGVQCVPQCVRRVRHRQGLHRVVPVLDFRNTKNTVAPLEVVTGTECLEGGTYGVTGERGHWGTGVRYGGHVRPRPPTAPYTCNLYFVVGTVDKVI